MWEMIERHAVALYKLDCLQVEGGGHWRRYHVGI